jgi:multisubunit Na+/H+ antiporter MnhB subunit
MKVRRHPVLGFFSGLFLGLGLVLMLFVFGVLPMTVLWLALFALGLAVLGVVVAYVLPGRGRTA